MAQTRYQEPPAFNHPSASYWNNHGAFDDPIGECKWNRNYSGVSSQKEKTSFFKRNEKKQWCPKKFHCLLPTNFSFETDVIRALNSCQVICSEGGNLEF